MKYIKNNVGDVVFDTTPDRYSAPIRFLIFILTAAMWPIIVLWMGCKSIGENDRIKG